MEWECHGADLDSMDCIFFSGHVVNLTGYNLELIVIGTMYNLEWICMVKVVFNLGFQLYGINCVWNDVIEWNNM